jgi:signal transduction histidine kinase
MLRRLIPFSRLSIVFMLAMILSGGVLTYFSINNISNLKELTEKRIIEEQQKLAVLFSTSLQEELEQLTAGLENGSDQVKKFTGMIPAKEREHEYVVQSFLIRDHEAFIFPNFTDIYGESLKPELSEGFVAAYQQGERAEFANNDPTKAADFYSSCLKLSVGAADSAAALNALGRVFVKSGEIEQATNHYIALVRDYLTISDRNGFPYAYYAMSGLVNHTVEKNRDKIKPVLERCLTSMEKGDVPLNYQSQELLDLVSEWSAEYLNDNGVYFKRFEKYLTSLKKQLIFIDRYGGELKAIIQEGNSRNEHQESNQNRIANLFSDSNPRFIVYCETGPFSAGFLIDRISFFHTIARTNLQEDFEFNYLFDFPVKNNSSFTSNKLIYSFHLNPFFPDQVVQIYPQNEDLISDLVKRRSWIWGMATFLLLAAMLLGIILTQRDIAREKNLVSLRSNFISNVTHELKTPLTSIRMYAESMMMRRVKSDPDQQKYLSVIVNESERLKRMINNILEFSKMEKARQEYHPVESNLPEILHSAILDMNYWLEKNSFKVKQEIQPEIKAFVDPDKLYQVFTNLLSNAIKYSGNSKIIYIRLYENHDAVITEVEDEGIGINEADQLKIFEDFYRVEKNESGGIPGTGLGLTVVREIVEAHNGKVRVESKAGKGSKFSVILFKQPRHENRSDHRR